MGASRLCADRPGRGPALRRCKRFFALEAHPQGSSQKLVVRTVCGDGTPVAVATIELSPSRTPLARHKRFQYQADSWTTARRFAKVERHVDELFPRVGFIVTNLPLSNCPVVRPYNKRGPPSHGSRKASRRRTGHGCRVTGSG